MITTLHINNDTSLNLNPEIINYIEWRYLNDNLQNDIEVILNILLDTLDCTIEYSSGRIMMTGYTVYQKALNEYYYYILKIDNFIEYNKWLDLLIDRHIKNVTFEKENEYISSPIVHKTKRNVKKNNNKNIYIKQESIDMFNNETIYIYENLKTGDIQKSSDPNLLDILNAKKSKIKKDKVTSVSLENMTFTFKKK